MKGIKKKKDNLNVEGIKKSEFIVFVDIDGTLDLKDKRLDSIIKLIRAAGGMVVIVTGRTVGDIKEYLKNNGIKLPPIIIGDNGAVLYSTVKDEFIIKKILGNEKNNKLVDYFNEIGGNQELIRYTDGSNIYASKDKAVKEYYKDSDTAKLYSKLEAKLRKSKDITKITLAGTKEEMEQVAKYAETLGFWTDMDATKFPEKEQGNYRLDIAPKNISKGEMVKVLVRYVKPEYGYMCVGNGFNDISMFEQAIDDGMIVGIMGNADSNLIEQMQDYTRKANKGKVMIVPKDNNKANRWIYKMFKLIYSKKKGKKHVGKKGSDKYNNFKHRIAVNQTGKVDFKKVKNNKVIPQYGEREEK